MITVIVCNRTVIYPIALSRNRILHFLQYILMPIFLKSWLLMVKADLQQELTLFRIIVNKCEDVIWVIMKEHFIENLQRVCFTGYNWRGAKSLLHQFPNLASQPSGRVYFKTVYRENACNMINNSIRLESAKMVTWRGLEKSSNISVYKLHKFCQCSLNFAFYPYV